MFYVDGKSPSRVYVCVFMETCIFIQDLHLVIYILQVHF